MRFFRLRPAAVALLLLSACAGRQPVPTDAPDRPPSPADVEQPAVVFEDHRFTLRSPAEGVSVLDGESARRINPDAVAGLLGAHGALIVILERAPGLDADDLADLVLDGVRLAEKRVVSREAVDFQGQAAVRTVTAGTIDGLPARLVHVIFVRDGVGHQVVAWGGDPDDVHGDGLAHLFDALTLLEGPVRLAPAFPDLREAVGAGWRVHDRRFESAASGLVVEPGDAFHIAVGGALAQMHDEAEVGLVGRDGDVHLIVIAERTPPHWFDAYRRAAWRQFQEGTGGVPDGEGIVLTVDGKPLRLERVPGPIDQHLGVYCRGDLCLQVQLWYLAGLRAEAHALLETSPPTIRLMAEEERAALETSLRPLARHGTVVGQDHAFREGVYTHYEAGLRIRLPDEGLWRVRTGQSVATRNPAALVEIEAPRLGIHGEVLVDWIEEKSGLREPARYHAAARMMYGDDGRAEPAPRRLGEAAALENAVVTKDGEFTWHHRVVTAVVGDLGFLVTLWGYPENMAEAEAAVDALLSGVEVAAGPLDPIVEEGMRHTDLRLGFTVVLPDGAWQPIDATPAQLAPIGAMRAWHRTDGADQAVLVAALYSGAGGDELSLVTELAAELMPTPPPGLAWQTDDYVAGELGGRPARCRTAAGRPGRMDLCMLVHGPMLYMTTWVSLGGVAEKPEPFFSTFALLGEDDAVVEGE